MPRWPPLAWGYYSLGQKSLTANQQSSILCPGNLCILPGYLYLGMCSKSTTPHMPLAGPQIPGEFPCETWWQVSPGGVAQFWMPRSGYFCLWLYNTLGN